MTPLRRLRLLLVAFMLALIVAPSAAFAAPPPPGNVDTTDVSSFVIAAPLVTLITGLLVPLINGFLTKPTTPTAVKAIGTIVLNAAVALLTAGLLADGTSAFSDTTLYTAVFGCIVSIVTYLGVYKPLNVTSNTGGKLAAVGVK